MDYYCEICEDRLDARNTDERDDTTNPRRCLGCQDEPDPVPEHEGYFQCDFCGRTNASVQKQFDANDEWVINLCTGAEVAECSSYDAACEERSFGEDCDSQRGE